MVLFTESTTPFVNLRWHLDVSGLKSSKLYIWNGVALFFGWLVLSEHTFHLNSSSTILIRLQKIARIILFIFFFLHMYNHFDEASILLCYPSSMEKCCVLIVLRTPSQLYTLQTCDGSVYDAKVKQIFPLGYYSVLTVPAMLAMMNIYWFWKIARGMVKTLAKAKAKKHDE
ncbi:hypothetical protein Ahy_B01g051554 isoform D [Arachis hypogaea]|uniref:TLC domain-containing protein n=1 Tax=Arachis hypogaea TaxID=3818 RepID=A0A445AM58_ARAHY|nr:hypothetical protein Ahy_B01g051554 isoform D [Arachis hypogaea]